MSWINFTPNFDLGHVFDALVYLVVFALLIITLRSDVKVLKRDMKEVKTEMEKISTVMVDLARTDERINSMETRLDDFIHGRFQVRKAASN